MITTSSPTRVYEYALGVLKRVTSVDAFSVEHFGFSCACACGSAEDVA